MGLYTDAIIRNVMKGSQSSVSLIIMPIFMPSVSKWRYPSTSEPMTEG